jgi:hypothetical protein
VAGSRSAGQPVELIFQRHGHSQTSTTPNLHGHPNEKEPKEPQGSRFTRVMGALPSDGTLGTEVQVGSTNSRAHVGRC